MDTIREAARRAAEADGIRKTARTIGVSATGFRAFLAGSNPFETTRKKLTAWYVRRVAAGEEGPSGGVAEAALSVLLGHLPPKEREEARREFVEMVKRKSKAARVAVPEWIEEV